MPLINIFDSDKEIELAVWETTEDQAYFRNKLSIHPRECGIIASLSIKKLKEWLGSRYLLHIMSGRKIRGEFVKDIHGKPHLVKSEFHISISHSRNFIAVMASKHSIGVDIQFYVEKITRIEHKFVNPSEIAQVSTKYYSEGLHIIWGAKESLYKAYGKKALDFRKNIFISNLSIKSKQGTFNGLIQKNDYKRAFILHYHLFDDYLLVYAKENN